MADAGCAPFSLRSLCVVAACENCDPDVLIAICTSVPGSLVYVGRPVTPGASITVPHGILERLCPNCIQGILLKCVQYTLYVGWG